MKAYLYISISPRGYWWFIISNRRERGDRLVGEAYGPFVSRAHARADAKRVINQRRHLALMGDRVVLV